MTTNFPKKDAQNTIKRYTERYNLYGYSPKTLGWNKNRQHIRFDALTKMFSLQGKRILDIGCGFGDLNYLLRRKCGDNYCYTGIDLVPKLIEKAKTLWSGDNIKFYVDDFLSIDLDQHFDIAIASGIFNYKLEQIDNYDYIELVMKKAISIVKEGFAFDFLSDNVDYKLEHTFHSNPSTILIMANKLTRRIILRNDYLPFEFAVIAFRDTEIDTMSGCYKRALKGPFHLESGE